MTWSIANYNATPSGNTTINGINIAEGCNASGVNDALRQMMADLASWIGAATGTGNLVLATNAVLTTPNLGVPSAGNLGNCTNIPLSGLAGLGSGIAAHLADNLPFPSTTDTLVGTKRSSSTVTAGGSVVVTLPDASAGIAVISAFNSVGYSTWFVGFDNANHFVGAVVLGKAQTAGTVDPIVSVVGNNAGNDTMTITGDGSGSNVTINVKLIPLTR